VADPWSNDPDRTTRSWQPDAPSSSVAGLNALRHRYGAPPAELEPTTVVVVRVELDDQAELIDRLLADLARHTGRTPADLAHAYGVPA
jgi:hypothetical protein